MLHGSTLKKRWSHALHKTRRLASQYALHPLQTTIAVPWIFAETTATKGFAVFQSPLTASHIQQAEVRHYVDFTECCQVVVVQREDFQRIPR